MLEPDWGCLLLLLLRQEALLLPGRVEAVGAGTALEGDIGGGAEFAPSPPSGVGRIGEDALLLPRRIEAVLALAALEGTCWP